MWNCERNSVGWSWWFVGVPFAGWLLMWLVGCVWVCVGCEGCEQSPLARLASHKGIAERDFANARQVWKPAKDGERFSVNDGVRTGASSTAELWLRDGSGLRMQQNAVIRFARSLPNRNQIGLKIEEGVIFIDAASDDFEINTKYGVAILKKGTRIKLTKSDEGILLHVQIGSARFLSEEDEQSLKEGQQLNIKMGTAVLISDAPLIDASESVDAVEDAGDTGSETAAARRELPAMDSASDSASADVPNGEKAKDGKGEETPDFLALVRETTQLPADMFIAAGESAWIHSPAMPVHVAIRVFGVCELGAFVTMRGKQQRVGGTAQVVIPLNMGRNRYAVHCVLSDGTLNREAVTKGMLFVVRDTGKVTLAQTPPLSTVLMDGRTYTVNYQTRLPTIRVKWPTAPDSNSFTLYVSGDSAQQYSLDKPQYLLAAGTLLEGTHTFKFVDDKSGVRSRNTTLKIHFDNVSDKAALIEPGDRAFAPGTLVRVRGTAMLDWEVSSPLGKIAMDSSSRFEGSLQHNTMYRAIWLKLSHAQRGVHYYLRRQATP
ncbi:MAG: FecR domain-containing protein [Deltaproteobacteria bacterium]|nr:FecR domain-containing protein [Deltaproteobacteria bacterium]